MTSYVIDTSALLHAFIIDTYTDHVRALLALLTEESPPELHFLDIGLAESANVLWRRVRFSGVPADQAHQLLKDLLALPLVIHDSRALLSDGLTIGLERTLAVYDSLYIALAKEPAYPLITADGPQERAAISVGVKIKAIADFKPESLT
jgi:predicted nucleic acid-binding protein